jgi:beta-glucosidase
MAMPGDGTYMADGNSVWGPHLTRAVMNGTIPADRLDDMATRIVAAWYQMGQDKWEEQGPNFSSWTNEEVGLIHPGSDDKAEDVVNKFVDASNTGDYSHRSLVRRVAAEGIVLLKNDKSFLPLGRNGWSQAAGGPERKCRVAVIGEDAVLDPGGPNVCADRSCNQGTLASGWGSGAVEFPYLISPLDAIQHSLYEKDVELTVWPTNDPPSKSHGSALAEQDICLVFANADSGEGYRATKDAKGDRNNLDLQKGGNQLVADVAAHCGGPVVLVIHAVGPVTIDEFAEHPNVHAILHAHLPGQESGRALQGE